MGIRIRNVQAEQLDQKIGLLTGMEGYEEQEERAEGELSLIHIYGNDRKRVRGASAGAACASGQHAAGNCSIP